MNGQAIGAALNALLDGCTLGEYDRARLRMLADDLEQDGTGAPLATELAYLLTVPDTPPELKEYARRLLGSVRKYGQIAYPD